MSGILGEFHGFGPFVLLPACFAEFSACVLFLSLDALLRNGLASRSCNPASPFLWGWSFASDPNMGLTLCYLPSQPAGRAHKVRTCMLCCIFSRQRSGSLEFWGTVIFLLVLLSFPDDWLKVEMRTNISEPRCWCIVLSQWLDGRAGCTGNMTDFFLLYFRGVLAVSWCQADPELLLSSAKDNRILCWNPSMGEVCNHNYQDTWSASHWVLCSVCVLPCILVECPCNSLKRVLCTLSVWSEWVWSISRLK